MSTKDPTKIVSIGEILAGKYRVERVLGAGGMGVVVAARHLELREMRAIKLMQPAELANKNALERFMREARAAVRLRSEHVAQVYDIGKLDSGAPFIVMELLQGHDLAQVLKQQGNFPVDLACLYIIQACTALEEAHGLGIIHRDLKPANLYLTHRKDGSPCIKVLDFGISKSTVPTGDGPEVEMTGTRDVMGSPLYMAPEQMRSAKNVDQRSDIWSLGAILYKLLTGRGPFQAATMPEIFAVTLDPKPARPPSLLRADIPKQLDAAILRCLEKTPTRRYGKVGDLAAALSNFLPRVSLVGDDDEGENAQTLLRPVAAQGDLTGTMPMGAEQLRAAARLGAANSAAARAAVGAAPKVEPSRSIPVGEIRDETTKEAPPKAAPAEVLKIQAAATQAQSGDLALPKAGARKLSVQGARTTLPLDHGLPVASPTPPEPPPPPRPPAPSEGVVAGLPASVAFQPPPIPAPANPANMGMQRRPSFTGAMILPPSEAAAMYRAPAPSQPGVAFSPSAPAPAPFMTPEPVSQPAPVQAEMQRRPSYVGESVSALTAQPDPFAQSGGAWPAAPPSVANPQMPLSQSTSGQFMAPSLPYAPSPLAAPGDGTGSSLPPWSPVSGSLSPTPKFDLKRQAALGGVLGVLVLALIFGFQHWRGNEPAADAASVPTGAVPSVVAAAPAAPPPSSAPVEPAPQPSSAEPREAAKPVVPTATPKSALPEQKPKAQSLASPASTPASASSRKSSGSATSKPSKRTRYWESRN